MASGALHGVRLAVAARGLRWVWIAQQLGVPRSTLSCWVAGRRTLPDRYRAPLARIVGLLTEELEDASTHPAAALAAAGLPHPAAGLAGNGPRRP